MGTRNPTGHLIRIVFGAFSMLFSFVSLIYLPMANALLGERLSRWVICGTILGLGAHVPSYRTQPRRRGRGRSSVSALAALDYTGLVWAMGFDLLLFAHWPTPLSWAGIAAILVAATMGFWRR